MARHLKRFRIRLAARYLRLDRSTDPIHQAAKQIAVDVGGEVFRVYPWAVVAIADQQLRVVARSSRPFPETIDRLQCDSPETYQQIYDPTGLVGRVGDSHALSECPSMVLSLVRQ